MITVSKLIQIAPFPEDVKKELLAAVPSFTPEKGYEVAETCWALISMDYQNKLQFRKQKLILDAAKENKAPDTAALQKIEDDLLAELTASIREASTEEELTEIRTKLSQVTTSTPPDKTVN